MSPGVRTRTHGLDDHPHSSRTPGLASRHRRLGATLKYLINRHTGAQLLPLRDMKLPLILVSVVGPLLLNSCALLQLPAKLINSVVSPLRVEGSETPPPGSMQTESMMSLRIHTVEGGEETGASARR